VEEKRERLRENKRRGGGGGEEKRENWEGRRGGVGGEGEESRGANVLCRLYRDGNYWLNAGRFSAREETYAFSARVPPGSWGTIGEGRRGRTFTHRNGVTLAEGRQEGKRGEGVGTKKGSGLQVDEQCTKKKSVKSRKIDQTKRGGEKEKERSCNRGRLCLWGHRAISLGGGSLPKIFSDTPLTKDKIGWKKAKEKKMP